MHRIFGSPDSRNRIFGFRKDWINGFGFIWIGLEVWFFLGLDWFGFFLDLDMLLRISDVKV